MTARRASRPWIVGLIGIGGRSGGVLVLSAVRDQLRQDRQARQDRQGVLVPPTGLDRSRHRPGRHRLPGGRRNRSAVKSPKSGFSSAPECGDPGGFAAVRCRRLREGRRPRSWRPGVQRTPTPPCASDRSRSIEAPARETSSPGRAPQPERSEKPEVRLFICARMRRPGRLRRRPVPPVAGGAPASFLASWRLGVLAYGTVRGGTRCEPAVHPATRSHGVRSAPRSFRGTDRVPGGRSTLRSKSPTSVPPGGRPSEKEEGGRDDRVVFENRAGDLLRAESRVSEQRKTAGASAWSGCRDRPPTGREPTVDSGGTSRCPPDPTGSTCDSNDEPTRPNPTRPRRPGRPPPDRGNPTSAPRAATSRSLELGATPHEVPSRSLQLGATPHEAPSRSHTTRRRRAGTRLLAFHSAAAAPAGWIRSRTCSSTSLPACWRTR